MLFSDCSHPDDQTTGWNISVLQWGKRELMKRRFKARTVTGRRIKPTLMHLNTNISITRSSLSHFKPNCSDQKGVLGPELRTLNFQPLSASLRRWCLSSLLREREGGGNPLMNWKNFIKEKKIWLSYLFERKNLLANLIFCFFHYASKHKYLLLTEHIVRVFFTVTLATKARFTCIVCKFHVLTYYM